MKEDLFYKLSGEEIDGRAKVRVEAVRNKERNVKEPECAGFDDSLGIGSEKMLRLGILRYLIWATESMKVP